MRGFFGELNFARVMILACLVGSCVLGWFIFQNYEKIKLQDERLAPNGRTAQIVRDIQSLSKRYTELYSRKADDKLTGQGSPQSYIDAIAAHEDAALGRVDFDVTKRAFSTNVVDQILTVTPNREGGLHRNNIANFLWKIEAESPRVRVTQVSMTALNNDGQPRPRIEEFPSDEWNFTCKVTSRQRVE